MTAKRFVSVTWGLGIALCVCLGPAISASAQSFSQPPKPPQPPKAPLPGPQQPQPGQPPTGSPFLTRPTFTPTPKFVSPLDPALDVGAAIESAKTKAGLEQRRVLVIWGIDETEWTMKMVTLMLSADMQRLQALEFPTVWAEIGKGEKAAANRELAKSLGVEVKADDLHPTLTVLDASGKMLASKSAGEMIDEIRQHAYSSMKVQDVLLPVKATPPVAKDILAASVTKARESGRWALLIFGQYGDAWTPKIRAWLAQPEVVASLGKYSVSTSVELLRDTGASELMESLGGTHVATLPWWAMVSGEGKLIASSQSAQMPNIAFPVYDEEIEAFLGLIKRGSPGLSDADSKTIRDSLVEHRKRKK